MKTIKTFHWAVLRVNCNNVVKSTIAIVTVIYDNMTSYCCSSINLSYSAWHCHMYHNQSTNIVQLVFVLYFAKYGDSAV